MLKAYRPISRLWLVTVLLAAAIACMEPSEPPDPGYVAEIQAWRDQRLLRLTAEDGWLSLTGLFWLETGENSFGSATSNAVVLSDPEVPAVAGTLVLGEDSRVTARAAGAAGVSINGEPLQEAVLKTDADGPPDLVTAGRNTFHIIDREGRLAARVKDPLAPARTGFPGLEHFPIDPALRVEACFEPYEAPRQVSIPTVLDRDTTMLAYGKLRFEIGGTELTLEPYVDGPDDDTLFVIFRDATSGATTYGAGRFLTAEAPDENDLTVLDFNRAYNPPCAFTPYATCPLPPPQNVLAVPIEAGERYSGAEDH